MKTKRYSARYRAGDSDRYSQAFFVLGALVVIAVAFFIGFQVGRIAEKRAEQERVGRKADEGAQEDIRREMSAYSEEAVRIPVVKPPPPPPPDAGEELKKTEATATFPDSLTRKNPAPQPLIKPKAPVEPGGKKRHFLQAGALKSREAAESLKGRIERGGFRARVIHVPGRKGEGKDLYKIRVGPHESREEALRAMKEIQAALKIDVILLKD